MHDWEKILFSEQLVQTRVIKRSITANNSFEKDAFNSFLLDQKFIETEETHEIWDKYLLGWITFILEYDCFEKLKQRIAFLAFNLTSVEVSFLLEVDLLEEKLTESFFKPWWQSVDLSYHLIVFWLALVEVSSASVLQLWVNNQLDKLLELGLSLSKDQFQVYFTEPRPLDITVLL